MPELLRCCDDLLQSKALVRPSRTEIVDFTRFDDITNLTNLKTTVVR